MVNHKIYIRSLAFGIMLMGLLPCFAFAQQADTKTVDKFNELNQLLAKDPKASPFEAPSSDGKLNRRIPMRINGKDTLINYPNILMPDGTVFVPAAKVRVNGKDTLIDMPLFIKGNEIPTYPANKLPGVAPIPNPNPDRMPALKPDMSKYNMPNMIKPDVKKSILLQDTVIKK